jgi:hypothetical protein
MGAATGPLAIEEAGDAEYQRSMLRRQNEANRGKDRWIPQQFQRSTEPVRKNRVRRFGDSGKDPFGRRGGLLQGSFI